MLIGYARVSKDDNSQTLDLQKDTLIQAGILGVTIGNGKYPALRH
ncbi:hypothetical protein NF27_EK00010 [Candidatus Jidaibacter acanthamoeba]|uniref:Resolvase/invertase-type recombinase catalytic domain-containing protein n=1 Tax=Candidatus Jidaibacter acanthamoebae TaxID=86105 RepID=A0A0C1MYZ6_9RICK|nr:hypothetical protein NF27_EK00010 [Candidatus Jidaibacter acanthamoeba]